MRKVTALALSMEMIDFQTGALYAELTTAIQQIMDTPTKERRKVAQTIGIDGIIKTHTGMNIDLHIDDNSELNAYVATEIVDGNSSFWRECGIVFDSTTTLKALEKAKQKLWGAIDLKNCRVSGYFADLPVEVHLFMGILNPENLAADGAAAIVLHELGHVFGEFETVGNLCRLNACVGAISREVMGVKDPARVRKIMDTAENIIGQKISCTEIMVNTPAEKRNDPSVQQVLITDLILNARSADGLSLYSAKASEQTADQFAVRHGAGLALATAMHTMLKPYAVFQRAETIFGYFSIAVGTVLLTSIGYLVPVVITLLLFSYLGGKGRNGLFNPAARYDGPKDRLEMIRKQMTYELRDRSLPTDRVRKVVSELDKVSKMVKDIPKERATFFEWAAYHINSNERREVRLERFAKVSEDLLMNDLFTVAAKYRSAN